MTTIGKILVVLHLVLSFMFMAFAGAVYTAQKNWKQVATTTQGELTKAKAATTDKQNELNTLQDQWAASTAALKAENDKLKGLTTSQDVEVKTMTADNKQLRKQLDQLRDQNVLASTEAGERKKESTIQREKNAEVYIDREKKLADLNDANDRIFAQDLLIAQLQEKHAQLLDDMKTMKAFLSSKELTTDPKQMKALTTPPPPLYGRVLDVLKPKRKTGLEYIEISIGRDSGLEVGHILTVYRGEKYLGQIRLSRVEADKSVGTVVLPKGKNADFQVGDIVTTTI